MAARWAAVAAGAEAASSCAVQGIKARTAPPQPPVARGACSEAGKWESAAKEVIGLSEGWGALAGLGSHGGMDGVAGRKNGVVAHG